MHEANKLALFLHRKHNGEGDGLDGGCTKFQGLIPAIQHVWWMDVACVALAGALSSLSNP